MVAKGLHEMYKINMLYTTCVGYMLDLSRYQYPTSKIIFPQNRSDSTPNMNTPYIINYYEIPNNRFVRCTISGRVQCNNIISKFNEIKIQYALQKLISFQFLTARKILYV